MTRTSGSSSERRSDSRRSMTASPRNAGVAPTRSMSRSPPTASATASTTDSQKCCASSSSRSTETHATRPPSASGPGSQEDRLPAAGRRADEQHAPWTAGGQRTEQRRCEEPAGARPMSDRRWRCARATHSSCVSLQRVRHYRVRCLTTRECARRTRSRGRPAAACGRPAFQDRSGRIDRAARIAGRRSGRPGRDRLGFEPAG